MLPPLKKEERAAGVGGPRREDWEYIINPTQFARQLANAAINDPGTERKAMLFYLDDEEIRFDRFTSEARVMVCHLTRRPHGRRQNKSR